MFTTKGGSILENGTPIQLRGVNHYGFNDKILKPMMLWVQGWKEQLAHIKSLGFNAIRCPFVPDTLYAAKGVDSFMIPLNDDLIGKSPLQMLDMWMAEADRLGLYILLDFHSVSAVNQYFHPFVTDPNEYGKGKWVETWNGQPYTTEDWVRDLCFVAKRYAHLPRFIAIDIFNEPHDRVRWTTGGDAQWKPLAESAANAILGANPNLLIFVQGITANWDGVEKAVEENWGENLQPQAYSPLSIRADKLVFCAHTYGPHVWNKASFSAPTFPKNLAADWETLFGFLSPKFAVCPSEWGSTYTGQDKVWADAWVDYLIAKGITSSFFWAYVNSPDSGAIMEGNPLTVRADKMTLLRRLWSAQAPQPVPPATTSYAVVDTLTNTRVGTLTLNKK
jgi:aryl-phospho-beta-D-glucosidase BglC (GH1 family)